MSAEHNKQYNDLTNKNYNDLTDYEKIEILMDSRNITLRLQDIEATVKRIELALIGNQSLGQTGLVERITMLEEEMDKQKQKLLTWSGIITGVVIAIEFIFKFIIGK